MYKMIISNYEEKEKVSAPFVQVLLMLCITNFVKLSNYYKPEQTTAKWENVCSKSTVKTFGPLYGIEIEHWCEIGETTAEVLLVSLLLTLNMYLNSRKDPANIYLFKFNNRNTKKRCEVCSKLTVTVHSSGVSIVNFEHSTNCLSVFDHFVGLALKG